jgi:hypothetical protein
VSCQIPYRHEDLFNDPQRDHSYVMADAELKGYKEDLLWHRLQAQTAEKFR